jgi:hypothetical protein
VVVAVVVVVQQVALAVAVLAVKQDQVLIMVH